MTAKEYLAEKSLKTAAALKAFLDARQSGPKRLDEAIRYSLFAGGKQFRPALALGASEIASGDDAAALPAACAIEMIHCYSLIHDDLPAMDDDDLRRGKPTLHKAFGEAMAILAGDALATMAFEMAAESGSIRVVREIAQAAGPQGMAGGQVLDLESEGKRITLEELMNLHSLKTGRLIRAAVRCGAILGGANDQLLAVLTRYGEYLGLAFQIADDILDIVGSEVTLGKPIGSDAALGKATYPALAGLDRSYELADAAARDAVAALDGLGPEADMFRLLARFVVDRES
ncbi:MAG TPA: polyprenyl synthetase family protein [Candidatus Hydrogenedentes bacterium]|nr:polyprenyl synthetase family protein [Candidatus Hydrogenedentota bacterium]HPG67723.1 polyprenyl synthetase family protein [Candidatus Hydrogenedentota bacterium]